MKAGSRAAGKNLLPLGVKAGHPAERRGSLLLGRRQGSAPSGRGPSPGPAAPAALMARLPAETRGLPGTRKEWDQLLYHIPTSHIITCQATEDQADISNPLKPSCEGWCQSSAASQLTDSQDMEKKTAS